MHRRKDLWGPDGKFLTELENSKRTFFFSGGV
jgi:hypothetical protein